MWLWFRISEEVWVRLVLATSHPSEAIIQAEILYWFLTLLGSSIHHIGSPSHNCTRRWNLPTQQPVSSSSVIYACTGAAVINCCSCCFFHFLRNADFRDPWADTPPKHLRFSVELHAGEKFRSKIWCDFPPNFLSQKHKKKHAAGPL